MLPSMSLTGQSGRTYTFTCHDLQEQWNAVAGCYAFASRRSNTLGVSVTTILYIGQTDSLQRRMAEHQSEKWAAAVRSGANMVLAVVVTNEAARLAMEEDLIRLYQPRLNTRYVPPNLLGSGFQPPRNQLLDL